jgi:tyrosyl-tRNA synthetase
VIAGRKLQQGMGQKPQVAIIMGESLPGTDGEIKMSKSLGNHIPLMGEAWDMFGKVMSVPDKAMPVFHKLILGWTPSQVGSLVQGLASGELHPNEVKMRLAYEIVSIFHSVEDADAAQRRWNEVFRSGGSGIPEDIPEETLVEAERVIDILRRLDMVDSGGEAKRLVQNKGIRLNETPISDANLVVTLEMLPAVLQVGKRKFVRLVRA